MNKNFPQVMLMLCKGIKQLIPLLSICTPATECLVRSVPLVDRRGMQSTGATDNDRKHPTTTISHIITSPYNKNTQD